MQKKGWGDLFVESFKEYGQKFKTFLLVFIFLFLIPLFIVGVIVMILFFMVFAIPSLSGMTISGLASQETIELISHSPSTSTMSLLLGVFIAIIFVIFILAFILLTTLINLSYIIIGFSSKEIGAKKAVKQGWKYFWRYLFLWVLIMLIFIALFIPDVIFILITVFAWSSFNMGLKIFFILLDVLLFFAGVIFWIMITNYLIFSQYVLIKENTRIVESMRKSWKMVKGRWWKVFGYALLFGLVMSGFSLAFSMILLPFNFLGSLFFPLGMISGFLPYAFNYLFLIPFSILFFKNFYLSLKEGRK